MIELRSTHSGSWFDAHAVPSLSAALTQRLTDRCRGHRGLFVTLTYRRDEYQDDRHLYEASQERKDVALFIRKVGRFLKRDLRGKWWCKLEFQTGGWVHWHLIILDVERIEHAEVTRLWGHGYVWLRKLSPTNIRYACKYVAKDGSCPAWIYNMPVRSVKVCRASKGFWNNPPGQPRDEMPQLQKLPGYRVIGQAIERAMNRCLMRDESGQVRRVGLSFVEVALALWSRGHEVVSLRRRGFAQFAVSGERFRHLVEEMGRSARASGRSALHLIRPGNRDAVRPWVERHVESMLRWECEP